MTETQPRRPTTPAEIVPWFLSFRLPDLLLALGQLIDRENSRPLPAGYADVLLDTTLFVLLDQTIADALTPVKDRLLSDLRRAAYLHGSMYDREYDVELRGTILPGGEAFKVITRSGYRDRIGADPDTDPPGSDTFDDKTIVFVPPEQTGEADSARTGWDEGRWIVRVSSIDGSDPMIFRLVRSVTTIGRASADKDLSVDIALDMPGRGISRKQLAVEWTEESRGAGTFRIYNLGLANVLIGDREIPGADVRASSFAFEDLQAHHSAVCAPGQEVLVGAPDIALYIEELPQEVDREKTVVVDV